ncbi:Phox-associated domain,Sorting nexin [Quillaja saponaria]|uniref:Phox-associated domain,Sorting nexin n=1 Tax=Quillaja saponaria TaxID=32244 RepID=A0AAD7M0G2_QUISA|nr:Phox-associated domain,Sorting nexin [Quillaja saponaria]
MKPMETIYDLIEEAKLRTVWWVLCIFVISYFLSNTSKSMWMNLPIAILFASLMRILFNEMEFRWKVPPLRPQTYLSHLEKKQLSENDSRLSTAAPPPKWKRKIDSPVVEAAVSDFVDKIMKDFVVDLWYSEITPDKESPEQIRSIIMDALGEISARVKEINLVDLLTRDIVDLVGDHFDLFRRNQAAIGVEVMGTLSSEERDERLKRHLMNSKELHPALVSPESEYKVLQRLMGGLLAVVLRPREAQCPVIRSIARELLTCLVMQPVLNLASPSYINELIEALLLLLNDERTKGFGEYQSTNAASHHHDHSVSAGGGNNDVSISKENQTFNQETDMQLAAVESKGETSLHYNALQDPLQPRPADWARMLEAATQRRTEVLMPENLENMWTKGRNYKKKENKNIRAGVLDLPAKVSAANSSSSNKILHKEKLTNRNEKYVETAEKPTPQLTHGLSLDALGSEKNTTGTQFSQEPNMNLILEGGHLVDAWEATNNSASNVYRSRLKRSNSTSDVKVQPDRDVGPIISEFYSPIIEGHSEGFHGKSASDMVVRREGEQTPKLRCQVMGAYFEKLGSKSFAVYSIAVTDAENRNWFVKRRYRNFERLHRHLKDIPNYTLHLPPKRIFSSSTEDAFVHQRCIQLDKYLQDLLSIANVAEQHEVWDFLSVTSKTYSFGKSSSVMRTLAVNVDDAVDDIVRQFKGVSDGLMRKVVGSSSPTDDSSSSITTQNLSWNAEEMDKSISRQITAETANSFSDIDEGEKDVNPGHDEVDDAQANGWHSDNELKSKSFPPRVIKCPDESRDLDPDRLRELLGKAATGQGVLAPNFTLIPGRLEDPVGMPPEWMPPNVSVPLLNLVDKIFQLKRRGWIRRQVLWISKQILQLVMEDAIDDWLLRQIYWLRREDIIAQGIRWIQDVLWPGGTFFLRIGITQTVIDDTEVDQKPFQTARRSSGSNVSKPGLFEMQLEAARRANDLKKMLFDGAPTALVSLIGHKQYRRCARDIYYFTQSTICVKQLAYAILELLLISVFPELRNLVLDVHEKMHVHQPV